MTRAFKISGVIGGDAGPFKAAVTEARAYAQSLASETGKGASASQSSSAALAKEASAIQAVTAARREQATASAAARSAFSDAMAGGGQSFGGMNTTAMSSSITSVSGLTRAVEDQSRAMVEAQRDAKNWQTVLDGVRAQHDPLFAASRQYEQELLRISEAEKIGAVSATQAAAARDRASQSLAPLNAGLTQNVKASGAANAANANLISQWNDIGVMMAAGQSPLQLALQQGTQVTQVFNQLGGGTNALKAVGTSFIGMLNPMSIATIGIIGFGAAGVQALMKLGGETKSFDEQLQDLDATVGRLTVGLNRVEGIRLEDRFGSLTGTVRGLTDGLIQLDRVAELKQLRETLDTTMKAATEPSFLTKMSFSIAAGAAPQAAGDVFSERSQEATGYARLKVANSYDDFEKRRESLMGSAKAGDIESVAAQVNELGKAMTGGGPFSEMSEDAQKVFGDMARLAVSVAEVEAQFNGSARDGKRNRQADEMVRSYQEQIELARAIVQYGENSAEVEAVQVAQSRTALALKMEEQGVDADSARSGRVYAAFEDAQAAKQAQADQERAKAVEDTMQTMQGQIDLSAAMLTFGRDAVEVQRLQNEQAKEALRTRLEELGVGEDQITKAEKLLELEQDRSAAVERAEAAKANARALSDLQNEAVIAQAMLAYGSDSLAVKRLQIDAAREEYRISLEQSKLSASERSARMQAWEAARGTGAADPYGLQAAASGMLKTRSEAIAKTQFEIALIGQSETEQAKLIALYEAEVEIRKAGIDTHSQAAQAIREQTALQADFNSELQKQVAIWSDIKSAGATAIDGVVDALKSGDVTGALEAIAAQIEGTFTELAISNPLKNAMLGQDNTTINDVGGLSGIWERLTGTPEAPDPMKAALGMPQAVSQMQVTAANVTISGSSAMSFMGGSASGAANLSGGLSGSGDVQAQAWAFFKGKGLEDHQVAGILGNIQRESAFNPLAVGDNGEAFGLFQHNDRKGKLFDAIGGKQNLGDVQSQLEFAWAELNSTESRAMSALQKSRTTQEATAAFAGFERPRGFSWADPTGSDGWSDRSSAAEAAMAKFANTTTVATDGLGELGGGFSAFGSALGDLDFGQMASGSGGGILSSLIGIGAKALKIPGFATGGMHSGGWRRVGENGPELEFTGPSAILPADITKSVLRGGAAVANSASSVINLQPTLVNNTSTQMHMDVQETTDSRGQRQQRYVLSDAVATGIATSGGKARQSMKSIYGLKQGGIAR